MNLTCPTCSSTTIKKNGHIHNGKQNHPCPQWGRQFVINPQNKIISEEGRVLIRQTLLKKVSLEGICRILTVDFFMRWVTVTFQEVPM